MLVKRYEETWVEMYKNNERFYFKEACWALSQRIAVAVISGWTTSSVCKNSEAHHSLFRKAIKYQNHNYGSNLNDVAFAPENRRWRYV